MIRSYILKVTWKNCRSRNAFFEVYSPQLGVFLLQRDMRIKFVWLAKTVG